jgi:hypothetical protein
MEHGFPGGPSRPPSGAPLRDGGPASDTSDSHGLPPEPPRGEPLPPAHPPEDDATATELPASQPAAPHDLSAPRDPWEGQAADHGVADEPAQATRSESGVVADPSADPAPGEDRYDGDTPTFAEVLAAQREQGLDAAPPQQPPPASAPSVGAPPPTSPTPDLPPPPANTAIPGAAAPPASTPSNAAASGGVSARRVGRWARNVVVGGLAAVGLLGVVGLMLGGDEADGGDGAQGGDEGAFAQVPVETCRDLELEEPEATFAAGGAPSVEIDGDGIGAPIWQAPLPGPLDGRVEPVTGDDGGTVTLVVTGSGDGGATSAHSVSYDLETGDVRGQLHLDARLQGAAGSTQWYLGTRGRSSLLFPVVDHEVVGCFAASPRPGSPSPPLAVEIDGQVLPLAPDGAEIAVSEDAAVVLLRTEDTRSLQRLGRDGTVVDGEVEDVVSVHATTDAFHALVRAPEQARLVSLDPVRLEERWSRPFPDELVYETARFAASGDTLSVVAGRDGDGQLHRFAATDGEPRGDGAHELDRPILAADEGTTYAVDPAPDDGTAPTRVLRLPDDGAGLDELDTPVLQPGLQPMSTTPTSVVLGARWEEDDAGGLLLRDGAVRASATAPFVAVGGEHVLAVTFVNGGTWLVALPLDPDDATDGDDADDDADEGDDGDDGGNGDGADDPADDPAGDADGPAGGDGPAGADGGGGTTSDAGGDGGTEVTDNADIDEEWLP